MLPVLFTLSVPAAWSKPLLALAVLAIALARAWSFRRRPAEGRERPGWGAALWDDKLTLAMLAAGAGAGPLGDLAFWVLVSALVGSRLYFIAVNWSDYFGDGAWVTLRGTRIPR